MSTFLTPNEERVLLQLAEVWNAYTALPVEHPSEQAEFLAAIHSLQRLVGVRAARRTQPDIWRVGGVGGTVDLDLDKHRS